MKQRLLVGLLIAFVISNLFMFDVKAAIEDLGKLVESRHNSFQPQDKAAYLDRFKELVEGYESPYPGLR